eukprot:CAMPEP_0198539684 /NCGR_PEP_ID=MMETSP1462-20131121/50022_1 /TAXON_ID=1333877 /ORGANISM="Brandtodinium nutriculum, Strain RCC3387" /LENGTH=306 /DNA_ID=CAMNT_0044269747 /DNA_START=82 /DNA_END=999 /DNA_ORIENTATION=+
MPTGHGMPIGRGSLLAMFAGLLGILMYILALNLSLHSMTISVDKHERYALRADVYLGSVEWTGDHEKVWDYARKEGKNRFHVQLGKDMSNAFVDGVLVKSEHVLQYVCSKRMKILWPGSCPYFTNLQVVGLLLITCIVLNAILGQGVACYMIYLLSTSKPEESRKLTLYAVLCIAMAAMCVLVAVFSFALHSWSDQGGELIDTNHNSGLSPGEMTLYLALACQAMQIALVVFATPTTEEAIEKWESMEGKPPGGYGAAAVLQPGGYGAAAVGVPVAVGVGPMVASNVMVTETTYTTTAIPASPVPN